MPATHSSCSPSTPELSTIATPMEMLQITESLTIEVQKEPSEYPESIDPPEYDVGVPIPLREQVEPREFLEALERMPPYTSLEPERPYDVIPDTQISYASDLETEDDDSDFDDNKSVNDKESEFDNAELDSTKYKSVQHLIIAKGRDINRLMTDRTMSETLIEEEKIEELTAFVRRKIIRHRGAEDALLSREEEKWLMEKLVFEALFPDAKRREFPGVRPKNLDRIETPIEAGDPKPCSSCSAYGVGNQECPLVETRKCAEHGEYDVRWGFETFIGKECPECQLEDEDCESQFDHEDWEKFLKEEEERRKREAEEVKT